MGVTIYRGSYLRAQCPKCNKPEEPLVNAFGELTINKCYLCSPHLNKGWGACGRYFPHVPELVENHDRFRSIRNLLRFLGGKGITLTPDKAFDVIETLRLLYSLKEEVRIPHGESYRKPREYQTMNKGEVEVTKFPLKTYGEKPRQVCRIHPRRKYFTWQRSKQDKLGYKTPNYNDSNIIRRTAGGGNYTPNLQIDDDALNKQLEEVFNL